jgi:hypothetical protein
MCYEHTLRTPQMADQCTDEEGKFPDSLQKFIPVTVKIVIPK